MKPRFFFALTFLFLSAMSWADIDIDSQSIGSENITEPAKRTPFSFNTHADYISPAKIKKGEHKGEKIHFAEAEVEAGMVIYYCPTYTEGLRLAVGYEATNLRWDQNPWFDQNHFNTFSLTLTGFSKRLDRWFWRTQLTANFDTENWNGDYTSYDILLWGRYTYCENIGVHLGFFAETGLRLDRVYPIIGFDWQISRKWKLNLVYPVNLSLDYALTSHWTLSLAGRLFTSRFRVKHDEISPRALVRYTNRGIEFAIKYERTNVTANLHAGVTGGGRYREANQHNKHAHTYKLESSGYAGAEMDVNF